MNTTNTPELRHLYINGQWIPAARTDERITVMGAATGQPVATVPAASAEQAVKAVDAARQAFAGWSSLTPGERADCLRRIADQLEQRSDALTKAVATEVGMPGKIASRVQVAAPIAAWRAFADRHPLLTEEATLGNSTIVKDPVGVVACITPWNYPLHQITCKLAPALLAGCTVVLKPSEVAPTAAVLLAEAVEAAGLPPGVFNMVIGYGPVVGEAIVTHRDTDMVSFTGSTVAGRRVASLAAGQIKRISMELGGKSASLVFEGADFAQAIKSTVNGCMLNSGQSCSATTRLLVPAGRYAEAVEMAAGFASAMKMGDPLDPSTRLGPLASATQQEKVRDFIRGAVDQGARIACGGAEQPADLPAGYFVAATVLADVAPGHRAAQEEIFGPVLCVLPYADEDEAIRIANDTAYGLAASVWAPDAAQSQRVARRLRAGQIDINGAPFNIAAPFGGFKQSGIGRENGPLGLEEFLEIKSIQTPVA